MTTETISEGFSARDILRSPAAQLLLYLLMVGILLVVTAEAFPLVRTLYVPNAPSVPDLTGFEEVAAGPDAWTPLFRSAADTAVLGVLALLGALLFAIPIVRIYAVTMRQEGYDKAFVRLLVALPVVVSGVVRIVQNDLALAFALAGIVAAVRFRTTVKDLQDASYAFAAIAVGLATGTGNFVMAGAISTIITGLAYAMWRLNVGDVGPSLELPYGGVRLSQALVPGEAQQPVVLGEKDRLTRVGPGDLDTLQEVINDLVGYVRADALRKKKKFNTLILAHVAADQVEKGRQDFEKALSKHSKRYVFVDAVHLDETSVVALEFLVRLKGSVDIGKMVDAFDCTAEGPLYAVELKPIGGLRGRLTDS